MSIAPINKNEHCAYDKNTKDESHNHLLFKLNYTFKSVLDCFGGAGTTALTANRLQRNAISIELNSDYIKMGQQRLPRLFGENTIEKGI